MTASSAGYPRSLLDLDDLQSAEIEALLARANSFHANPPSRDLLRDVCVVNLFFEASTRTYTSFAIAEQRVGADVVALPPGSSSLGKGETIADTAITLGAMGVRVIVTRHPESGFPYRLAESFDGHVINAGDGRHAHPTQALLDLLTLRTEFGRVEGLRVALVGDILHSRVARSNIIGLCALGAEVILVGPETLLPSAMARAGVRIERDLDAVLPEVDALMLLRIQRERIASAVLPSLDDYARNYRLDARRLAKLGANAIVMHPGPYNRGVELTEDVFAFPGWRYAQQVSHGVYVRMAVLDFLVNGAPQAATANQVRSIRRSANGREPTGYIATMGMKDELKLIGDATKDVLRGPEPVTGLPGVATPDQTRHDGVRPELTGELSQPETSGDLE